MNKTVEIVRESRTDQKMSEENGRWGMRSGCKLKGYQFFREIIMFFRKCHSFLLLINSFNFDGKMVRNVGDFLPINIRSLTKHTFRCNSPIIANRGSSPVTLKKIQFISNFWGFLRLCGIGFQTQYSVKYHLKTLYLRGPKSKTMFILLFVLICGGHRWRGRTRTFPFVNCIIQPHVATTLVSFRKVVGICI